MAAQDYEQVTYNSPAGAQIGQSGTEKIGFYGAVPVVQRSSTIQASTVPVDSWISVTSNLSDWAQEVSATLVALGIWKGS